MVSRPHTVPERPAELPAATVLWVGLTGACAGRAGERSEAVLRELVSPVVVNRGGKVAAVSPAHLVAHFRSAESAAWAALEIQFGLHLRNSMGGDDDRLDVRISINIGHDHGEHVSKVAESLQAGGAEGDILLSPSAYFAIHDVVDIAVRKHAPVHLPAGDIEVYEAVWRAGGPPTGARPPRPEERQIALCTGKAGVFHRLLGWRR